MARNLNDLHYRVIVELNLPIIARHKTRSEDRIVIYFRLERPLRRDCLGSILTEISNLLPPPQQCLRFLAMCLHRGIVIDRCLQCNDSCLCLGGICQNPPLERDLGPVFIQSMGHAFKYMVPPVLLFHITQTCGYLGAVARSMRCDLVIAGVVLMVNWC